MFIPAGPLALPILWWLVYISTDHLILVSSHAPFWFIGGILKSLQFPGRVKDLFCTSLFLPARYVAIHPCFLTTLQHRPLLVDLVLTWLSGNHPEGSSEDKVRGPTCVLLKNSVPTSLLACQPTVGYPDPLLVCTSGQRTLRRFSFPSYWIAQYLVYERCPVLFEWLKVLDHLGIRE